MSFGCVMADSPSDYLRVVYRRWIVAACATAWNCGAIPSSGTWTHPAEMLHGCRPHSAAIPQEQVAGPWRLFQGRSPYVCGGIGHGQIYLEATGALKVRQLHGAWRPFDLHQLGRHLLLLLCTLACVRGVLSFFPGGVGLSEREVMTNTNRGPLHHRYMVYLQLSDPGTMA